MSGDPSDEAEFRRLFLAEATEQLDRIADTVLELERAGGGADLVATLFRDAHTLKSSAAVVGFGMVADVAHELEDLLGELRAGRRTVTPGLADGVLEVVDALRAMVAAGMGGGSEAEHGDAAYAGLARAMAADDDSREAPGASYEDAGFRQLFADEVGPELERLTLTALELERRGPEPELVAALFRGAHSLKGSAAVIGFGEVSELAHRLEDRLDELRARRRPASPAFVDAVLATLDAVRNATPLLVAGEDAGAMLAPGRAALEALEAAAEPDPPEPPAAAPAPAPAPPAPEVPEAAGSPAPAPPADADRLVPVGLDRLDALVRLSGEAVAAGLRLSHLLRKHIAGDVAAEAAALDLRRTLASVQTQTMRTRMTTLEGIAGNLRRAVRDVARASGKEVHYELEGERVELDRAVLDGLRDPLLHLVRNAVDHGLERPGDRERAGKPRAGTVRVVAERRGPEITITVTDDGRGLDLDGLRRTAGEPELDPREAADLVFRPGLSTADAVTDISGRGVGLDAVRTQVEALRGRVEVGSEPGRGCRFVVTVPLTLAVVPCVLLEAAGERYHLPTQATRRITDDRGAELGLEGGVAIWVGGDVVPVSDLAAALGTPGAPPTGPAVVLGGPGGLQHAFRVDAVLGQRDVTVKELGAVVPRTALVAGASIEADGSVVLVLDPVALVEAAGRRRRAAVAAHPSPPPAATAPPRAVDILVVDDALTVRELQRSILERAGYAVRVAVDGEDALTLLAESRPDLVITDVEMPRLDGYGLASTIRRRPGLESVPVLMVSSRATPADLRRGLEAGADAYIVKQDFDAERLLEAVTRLLGD